MTPGRKPAVGKTPAMTFILGYLREFPGAGYARVKAASQAAGFGVPAPVVYGNALRLVKNESAPLPPAGESPTASRRGRRQSRAVEDLAGFVEHLQSAIGDRDRLRRAADEILAVIRRVRGGRA